MLSLHRRLFLFLATLFLSFAIPGIAHATTYTVCARLTTSFENVGGGEDYIIDADGLYSAMYQRVLVMRSGVVYANSYLSATGCISFNSVYSNNYDVYFFSEVQVPRTDNAAQTNIGKITDSSDDLASWYWLHTFTGSSKTFDIPSGWPTNLVVATRQSMFVSVQ